MLDSSAGSLAAPAQRLDHRRGLRPLSATAKARRELRYVSPFAPRPLSSLGMRVMVSTGALSGGARLRPSSLIGAVYRMLLVLLGLAVLAFVFGRELLREFATWAM